MFLLRISNLSTHSFYYYKSRLIDYICYSFLVGELTLVVYLLISYLAIMTSFKFLGISNKHLHFVACVPGAAVLSWMLKRATLSMIVDFNLKAFVYTE